MKQFRVFGCPAVFKEYGFSDKGKRTKDKFSRQGIRGIFVGLPDDSAGWLFYIPDAKRTFISMDVVFDKSSHNNDNMVTEHTSEPTAGHIQTFGNRSDSSEHDKHDINTRTL